MSLDPNVGPIPEVDGSLSHRPAQILQHHPQRNLPLTAAEELALELEAERDRLRLVQRLKASDNIYEQAECLQGLVLLLGREGEIPYTESGSKASGDSVEETIRLETLLDQLWERASHGRPLECAAQGRWTTRMVRWRA